MNKNGFKLEKVRSRRYTVQTITDADYADDIALLAKTSALAESLLHSLEWTAGGIGLHVNADKTNYRHFNQTGEISTLNGDSAKLVDKFTYFGSSISPTKNDINKRLAQAWTAIDKPSVICKTDLSDKIKRNFFHAAIVSILLYWCIIWTLTSLMAITQGCYDLYQTNSGSNIPQNSSCTATYHLSRRPSKLDDEDIRDTAGGSRMNS